MAVLLGLLGLDALASGGRRGELDGPAPPALAAPAPEPSDAPRPACCEVRSNLRRLASLPGVSRSLPPPCEGTPEHPHAPRPGA
jgi:hypothetical protein